MDLLEYPAHDIRKGAVTAISNFVCATAKMVEKNPENAELKESEWMPWLRNI